jgi:membrane protease YdiL (CAAX protease family)
VITALALAASFGLDLVSRHLHVDQIDKAVRTGLFVTLVFYVVLGALVAWYVTSRRVRLVWARRGIADALMLGLPVGLALGTVAVGLNSLAHGRLAGDPNAEMWVGGGGVLRLGLTLIVASVLAPLVEETLFRGVCAGSVLAKGPAPALLVSAAAFAIWHMNLTSLRYYSLMGLLLGGLWLKRGLVASLAAHAVFNGMLTIAAIAATSGAGHLTQWADVSFVLPGGWHQFGDGAAAATFAGPAAAGLIVTRSLPAAMPTVDELVGSLQERESATADMRVVPGSEKVVQIDGRPAAAAEIVSAGQPGHVVRVAGDQAVYTLVMVTSGSPNADRDWRSVLNTLHTR